MNVKADDSDAWGYIESIARPIVHSKTPFIYTPVKEGGTPPVDRDELRSSSISDAEAAYGAFTGGDSARYGKFSAQRVVGKCNSKREGNTKSKNVMPVYQENCGLVSCIDRNTKARIDKGLYPIDELLDLHGYSQDAACSVLLNFITNSFMSGHRCVLVITGWGSKNSGKSSIRSNFHQWIQSTKISNMLLYYTQAIPSHGGKGAFYVLLRKRQKLT